MVISKTEGTTLTLDHKKRDGSTVTSTIRFDTKGAAFVKKHIKNLTIDTALSTDNIRFKKDSAKLTSEYAGMTLKKAILKAVKGIDAGKQRVAYKEGFGNDMRAANLTLV
jgi:hypothetical protein